MRTHFYTMPGTLAKPPGDLGKLHAIGFGVGLATRTKCALAVCLTRLKSDRIALFCRRFFILYSPARSVSFAENLSDVLWRTKGCSDGRFHPPISYCQFLNFFLINL